MNCLSLSKRLLLSLVHFITVIFLWYLALGVVLGLGFKSDWNLFDYGLTTIVAVSLLLLGLPSVLVSFVDTDLPTWVFPLILSIQLIYGFLQVNLVSTLLQRRNHKINKIE